MREAGGEELLALQRRLEFGVLPQIPMGAGLLDFLGEDEVQLVIEPFDFVVQFLLERVEHSQGLRS